MAPVAPCRSRPTSDASSGSRRPSTATSKPLAAPAPLSAILRYLNEREFPLRYRLVAMGVHLRLWVVEMKEAVRLLIMRRPPERR